jgi:hypothetical protein
LAPEQRQWLESESVADFPEVELRILASPQAQPLLAEVVFPPTMSIAQAKEYIYRELEELPIRAPGHSLLWEEEVERLVLRLAGTPAAPAAAVALEPGIREMVGGLANAADPDRPGVVPWYTCRVEFDRQAGWHRQRAEEWVQEHLGLRDLGRTALLDEQYRMHPGLAAFLSDTLFAGWYRSPGDPAFAAERHLPVPGATTAVEFVPVPALAPQRRGEGGNAGRSDARRPGGRGAGTPPPRPPSGGAGLELNLTDPRNHDRLPAELRPGLGVGGMVNLVEAQAVVRTLEGWATDPGFRAALARRPPPAVRCPVGVLALYPAQAQLIRHLIRQSPVLAGADLPVTVDVPGAFREQECLVVLLSLTRSHTHRAVAYGEGPQLLTLALTRARAHLRIFGDVGTLTRRSQWTGPLEHLDEAAAAQEREVALRLVRYLQGQGLHQQAFHLREGCGA